MKSTTMSPIKLKQNVRRRRLGSEWPDSSASLTPLAQSDSSPLGTSIYEVMARRLKRYTDADVEGGFPSFLETLYFDSVIADGGDPASLSDDVGANVSSIQNAVLLRRSARK